MATTKDFLNKNDEMVRFKIDYVGKMNNPYFDADSNRHNKVTIRNLATKKSATFNYWGSVKQPNQDSEDGLKCALDCILMDISSYECAKNFDDFCSELGYDNDSRNAERIYNACGKEYEKFMRVVSDDYNIVDNIRNWIGY